MTRRSESCIRSAAFFSFSEPRTVSRAAHAISGRSCLTRLLRARLFSQTNAHFSVCHLLEIAGNITPVVLVITSEQAGGPAPHRGKDGNASPQRLARSASKGP